MLLISIMMMMLRWAMLCFRIIIYICNSELGLQDYATEKLLLLLFRPHFSYFIIILHFYLIFIMFIRRFIVIHRTRTATAILLYMSFSHSSSRLYTPLKCIYIHICNLLYISTNIPRIVVECGVYIQQNKECDTIVQHKHKHSNSREWKMKIGQKWYEIVYSIFNVTRFEVFLYSSE